MNKIRLAVIGNIGNKIPPENYGGVERLISDLVSEIDKHPSQYQVTLFALNGSKIDYENINVVLHGCSGWGLPIEQQYYNLISEHLKGFDILLDFTTFQLACRNTVDVPHLVFCSGSNKQRSFYNVQHGNYIAISQYFLKTLQDWGFAGSSDYHCHPSVSCATEPNYGQRQPFILSLSRLTPYKQIQVAIQAASIRNTELRLVGAGKEENYFQKIIAPRLSNSTIYVGGVSEQQKVSYMRRASATVVPAMTERLDPNRSLDPFHIAMIQCAMHGCPIISGNQQVISQLFKDAPPNCVYRTDYVWQMANTFQHVIQNPLTEQQTREWVSWLKEKFSTENFYNRMNAIILKHINRE